MIGFLIAITSLAALASNYSYHVGDYYHGRPGFTAFVVGIVLAWLYLCHVAVKNIAANRVFEVIYYWSRNVNVIYLVQWVLIMWGADAILGFNTSSYPATITAMVIMVLASHAITVAYLHFTRPDISIVPAKA